MFNRKHNTRTIEDSSIRFAAHLREKLNEDHTIDADPSWLPGADGITVIEHTGMHELDEETQNRLMRLKEEHEAYKRQLSETQRLQKIGNAYETVRVPRITL